MNQGNHKDPKAQSDKKQNINEHRWFIDDGENSLLSQVLAGLEDVKQGRFSGKSILDIGMEEDQC